MAEQSSEYPHLTKLLRDKGHSDEEIAKILEKVRNYDQQMQVDSVMDSIAAGTLDLAAIIDEALKE